MSINPDQAIFDAIVAATSYDGGIVINVQKFIETFNSHRDRKLCTSLDVAQTPDDEAARYLRLSISVTDVEKHRALNVLCREIERLRGVAQAQRIPREPTEEMLKAAGVVRGGSYYQAWLDMWDAAQTPSHSPPAFHAPHNFGERLPSGDAADAGGEQ